MEIISNCTEVEIMLAAQALRDGHLVAFPTETVYGLGADATNEKAIGRVYSVKGRPTGHPLIVHISSMKQIDNWAIDIPEYADKLMQAFWPGPLTVILKRSRLAKDFITGHQESVALRIPNQRVALNLLQQFESLGGLGIAAPSANRYQSISPTSASDVSIELAMFLELSDLILDGGRCSIGIESTIVNCLGGTPQILRPGAILPEDIYNITGLKVASNNAPIKIKAPGTLGFHYSPRAEVILNQPPLAGNGFLALSSVATPKDVVRLGIPKDVKEFAKVLFQALRLGDQIGLKKIVVQTPKSEGLGIAIKNRLEKMQRS